MLRAGLLTAMRRAWARALRATSVPTLATVRRWLPLWGLGVAVMVVSWSAVPCGGGLAGLFQKTGVSGKYGLLIESHQWN